MKHDAAYPLVFDVRGFSLDDGPGIRTTVFLKGCPLSCAWCHNPESWKAEREIAFYPRLCIGCGDCVRSCPEGAAGMDLPGRIQRSRCTACGACVDACPSTALKVVGMHYEPDELVALLLDNRVFYEISGGGVTFSGGEPTLHMDYLRRVMQRLKQQGVHIAVQTSGMFELREFREKVLPFTDLIYYDIKFLDSGLHKKYTGAGNERILENFRALRKEADVELVPRTPLIPGITAEEKNIDAIARFVKAEGCERYDLLPYNPGGIGKRQAIGRTGGRGLPSGMMGVEEEGAWMSFARDKHSGG